VVLRQFRWPPIDRIPPGHRPQARSLMAQVHFERVTKAFGSVTALSELTLTVPNGTFLALLGPSGCGKTTALRIVAGLEQPTSGRVFIDELDVTLLEPRKRDVAMVFQNYALYPHMNVARNIGYPLRIRGVDELAITGRVQEVARLLTIEQLLGRKPRELSGGQRQRVALARAIIREPRAFLMDEPLSNLDAKLRLQMRGEIKHLQQALGTTTIFVTHDQAEALTMADLIAVIDNGLLQQLGSPDEIYYEPANSFVATFVGSPGMNLLPCVLDGPAQILRGQGWVQEIGAAAESLVGELSYKEVELGLRPEDVELLDHEKAATIRAEVYAVEPMGSDTLVELRVDHARFMVKTGARFRAASGSPCWLDLSTSRKFFFDPSTGRRLLAGRKGGLSTQRLEGDEVTMTGAGQSGDKR
jgi:multiple sugar transport system ATP-binding protein